MSCCLDAAGWDWTRKTNDKDAHEECIEQDAQQRVSEQGLR